MICPYCPNPEQEALLQGHEREFTVWKDGKPREVEVDVFTCSRCNKILAVLKR